MRHRLNVIAAFVLCVCAAGHGQADGVARRVIRGEAAGPNLLKADAWRPWREGFTTEDGVFVCDNKDDGQVQRGVSQTITLNQTAPEPIVATAWSRAESVAGGRDNDYALYLDLVYTDGTPLWGQTAPFDVGSHDWRQRKVIVFPEKPVQSLSFHLLLRSHAGKAWFRDPQLTVLAQPEGACLFDGVPVSLAAPSTARFEVRDVAADSDFCSMGILPMAHGQDARATEGEALGVKIESAVKRADGATFLDVTLTDTTGKDRAIALYYVVPVEGDGLMWLHDPRTTMPAVRPREYFNGGSFRAGANGRLSRYPFAAVAGGQRGTAIGIDMAHPAFYRVGFNAATRELFIAYDIGLAPEKPAARLRFCTFDFDLCGMGILPVVHGQDARATSAHATPQFRAAMARYYELFAEAFACRIKDQGQWMPFARISEVAGWRDFGFRFKEGNNETAWDDAHDMLTFRYTEPMTWWMRMEKGTPRTLEAAMSEAQRLAEQGNASAKAWLTSTYHDETGRPPAKMLDTPWCDGAVWSMNSMPGIAWHGHPAHEPTASMAVPPTDFSNKWNPALREQLYGAGRKGDLDGEYIDSSEGYVTDELDFRRDHFAAAATPLTFSLGDHKPAIFRGLIVFEYIRAIAADVHGMNKFMMANSTPSRLCWLAPLLDVMGTETDWNPGGEWRPMSDGELLYRRAICGGKPFCFLMNTEFEKFPHERVERYMKRSLAYGMFPGFFSHNASQGHYFTRPELYERDRDLFKKYVPLCKRVAEAGWRPVTKARSSDERVLIERFGDTRFTVLNDSGDKRTATITFEDRGSHSVREAVTGKTLSVKDGRLELTLEPEDVAVLEFGQ
jgi:hypothetical protein